MKKNVTEVPTNNTAKKKIRIRRIVGSIVVLFFVANLGALIDGFLHPEIEYFDTENLIVGGITALVTGVIFLFLLLHIIRLEKAMEVIKQTKNELHESEKRFSLFMDYLPASIFLKDHEGRTLFVNKYMKETLDAGKWMGKTMLEVFPNEIGEKFFADDMSVLTSGYKKIEEDVMHLNGELHNYETQKFIIPQEGEQPLLGGISLDITERENAKQALIKREADYRKLFEEHSAVKLIIDIETGTILDANKAAETFYGWTKNELIHKKIEEINTLPPEQAKVEIQKAKDKQKNRFEFKHRLADGTIKDVEAYVANTTMGGKNCLTSIIIDETERKTAEEKILKLNEELQKLNSSKDKFFSIIAHDLKSPFQGFLGLTEIMSKEGNCFSADELLQFGKQMNEKARNLFELLKNLLSWSQMQNGTMELKPEVCSLTTLVEISAEALSMRCQQKEITVINKLTEPINIFADEHMINSVLLNLLSNAAKFTHRKGQIVLEAKQIEHQQIQVTVRDSGIGIEKSLMEKLFMVGEKIGHVGTEGELSTGLGLILCKEFVERNGGKIWAESIVGGGSSFYFTVPASV